MKTPRGINVSKFINNSKLLLKFARVSLLPTDNAFSTLYGSKLYIYISEIHSRSTVGNRVLCHRARLES